MTREELEALARADAALQKANIAMAKATLLSRDPEVREGEVQSAVWDTLRATGSARYEVQQIIRRAEMGWRGRLRMRLLGHPARLEPLATAPPITLPPPRDTSQPTS